MRQDQQKPQLQALSLRLTAPHHPLPPYLREFSYLTSVEEWGMRPHAHSGIEIIGCFAGRIMVETAGRRPEFDNLHVVPAGSLLVINARYRHRVRVLSPPYGRWLIHIDGIDALPGLREMAAPILFTPAGLDPQMRISFQLAFQQLFAELRAGEAQAGDKIWRQLTHIMTLIDRTDDTAGRAMAPARLRPSHTVSEVIRRVHRDLHEGLSVNELAQEAGYSTAHLQRMFRSEMGLPISQYIVMQRIEQAGRLLVDHGATLRIGDVATALGFASESYFSRYFRRHTGLSPNECRELLAGRTGGSGEDAGAVGSL